MQERSRKSGRVPQKQHKSLDKEVTFFVMKMDRYMKDDVQFYQRDQKGKRKNVNSCEITNLP